MVCIVNWILQKPTLFFMIQSLEAGARRSYRNKSNFAPRAKMQLQEPRGGFRSKDGAAEAKMWLQDKNEAAGAKEMAAEANI